jgi:hypothetical protein
LEYIGVLLIELKFAFITFKFKAASLSLFRMKAVLTTILLAVFFVVNTGFVVNLHYCMDRYHSWELGTSEKEKCGTCGMKNSTTNDCCRDEVKLIKLQQDQVHAKDLVVHFALPELILKTSSFLLLPFQNTSPVSHYFDTGPPLISKQDTYLQNCVFRI